MTAFLLENNHYKFFVGGLGMFDSFVLLSGCAYASGAAYEIIIACIVGTVTLLIENSRPHISSSERSQGSMTLQSSKCEIKPEIHPFTKATSPHWNTRFSFHLTVGSV